MLLAIVTSFTTPTVLFYNMDSVRGSSAVMTHGIIFNNIVNSEVQVFYAGYADIVEYVTNPTPGTTPITFSKKQGFITAYDDKYTC